MQKMNPEPLECTSLSLELKDEPPEPISSARPLFTTNDAQALEKGVTGCGWWSGGVDEAACGLLHPLNHGGMSSDKGPRHSCCLAKGAHQNDTVTADLGEGQSASALITQDTHAVCIVHHHKRIESLSQVNQPC
jgi:hypothetical protein